MENMTSIQARILAKAVSDAWDELPDAGEAEYGEATEKKARQAMAKALASAEAADAGIKPNEEQASDIIGQFQVYLESMENIGDLTRMEDELAELFSAE